MKKIIIASAIALTFAAPHAFAADNDTATRPAAELNQNNASNGTSMAPKEGDVADTNLKPANELNRELSDGTAISPSANDDAVADNNVKPAQEINKENATN